MAAHPDFGQLKVKHFISAQFNSTNAFFRLPKFWRTEKGHLDKERTFAVCLRKDPEGPGMSRSFKERFHKLPDAYCPGSGTCSLRGCCVGVGIHGSSSAFGQVIVGGGRIGLLGSIEHGGPEPFAFGHPCWLVP